MIECPSRYVKNSISHGINKKDSIQKLWRLKYIDGQILNKIQNILI